MEHQTCTSLGAFYETIVAHELAHQWWGDMVTCADFHHVWLNEGFATYCEALWLEQPTAAGWLLGQMNWHPSTTARNDLRAGSERLEPHLRLQPLVQQGLLGAAHAART